MKIAVIGAKGIPPKQGGIEHYCAEIYPRMVSQGHSVDLFARSSYTESPGWESYDYEGVRVISLPGVNYTGMDAFVTSAIGAIASTGKKYDIIHFHALGPSLFTSIPRIADSAKIVVTCHGLDWQRAKWGSISTKMIQLGEKAGVRFSHGMIVVSQALQTYFLQTYGKETVYIPTAPPTYGQSDPNFAYGTSLGVEKGRYVLFVARMVPEKRPDLLIDAFSALKPKGWKLLLVGSLSDTKTFTAELLKKVTNQDNIIFAGELRGSRYWEIVRGAGLFVLPSEVEGLPLSMLEAMREGIPVVGSDIPAHRELLGDDRGMLFESGNLNSCISTLDQALHNPQKLALMASNAQKHVALNYHWDAIANETLELYGKVLNSSQTLGRLQSKTQDRDFAQVGHRK